MAGAKTPCVRLGRGSVLLAGLVLVSAALRAWAGRAVTTPWISPDEPAYALLGRSLYATGRLQILNGPTGFLSATAPALFGLPLSLGNLELGYTIAKVVDACVMSLAAVPVYLWGRALVSRGWALVAAALTLALPGLAYSGLLMTEVVFYPVLVCAAWSLAAAIESPTVPRQLLFIALLAVAVLTRVQAIVLVVGFAGAVSLEWLFARRVRLRVFTPTVAAIAVLIAVRVAANAITGGSMFGGYGGADRDYPLGSAVRYVLYHWGDLALLTGFLPFCAVGVLLAGAVARGEDDPRLRAYLAVVTALACTFVVEVGVFASQNVHHLAERDLIALAPLLFLGFAVWLARGGGGLVTRGGVAAIAALLVLLIPVGSFVAGVSLVDAFSLIPLYHLRGLTSSVVTAGVLAAGVVAAGCALRVPASPLRRPAAGHRRCRTHRRVGRGEQAGRGRVGRPASALRGIGSAMDRRRRDRPGLLPLRPADSGERSLADAVLEPLDHGRLRSAAVVALRPRPTAGGANLAERAGAHPCGRATAAVVRSRLAAVRARRATGRVLAADRRPRGLRRLEGREAAAGRE